MRQREFDIKSNDNTLFVTEQCNNNCLMCCQPPRSVDDIDLLYEENMERIHGAPKDLKVIGITGGEPTLLGNRLIELITTIRHELPDTDIQLLTNGRNFKDASYARRVVEAGEGKIFFGIPLHSDYYKDHDIIAGAKGAYKETMVGMYNLAMAGACIELRIVMNALNYTRFPALADFIHKNLPFVGWIAFMGMEEIGHAVSNRQNIWVQPKQYIQELTVAVKALADWGYDVNIYNIPMCLLPGSMHPYARKSISDWKNKFSSKCANCIQKDNCCGLFSTSVSEYEGINPFTK